MKTEYCLLLLVCCLATSDLHAQSPYEHRDRGLLLGAVLGGLTGGAIGDQNDEALAGAAIGTAVGAVTGAAIGDSIDADAARRNAVQYQLQNVAMSRAVTVDDVIAMTHAPLSDNVIVTQIHTNGVAYQPQTADLVRMSQAGVSDTVIGAMQTARPASVPVPCPGHHAPVIVERRYVRPVYPPTMYYPRHRYYGPSHRHAGAHWGITIGR